MKGRSLLLAAGAVQPLCLAGFARADGLIPPALQLAPVSQFSGTTAFVAPDYRQRRDALRNRQPIAARRR